MYFNLLHELVFNGSQIPSDIAGRQEYNLKMGAVRQRRLVATHACSHLVSTNGREGGESILRYEESGGSRIRGHLLSGSNIVG